MKTYSFQAPGARSDSCAINISTRRTIAEKLLGGVNWQGDIVGFCNCPGKSQHQTPTNLKSCRVAVDGAPTVFCLHQSCAAEIEAANKELRRAIAAAENGGGAKVKKRKPSPEELKRQAEAAAAARLKARAAASLPDILKTCSWSPEEAWLESPLVSEDVAQDWKLLLSLYPQEATLWIASDVRESGRKENQRNFRTTAEWIKEKICPGSFICPAIFKPGIYSRSQENINARPFLAVESDTLKKEEICSVFRWLRQSLRLRAIVDTGKRSLHGWFDFPSEMILAELKVILPAMGCDPALFRPAQPVRLPGARRGNKWQSLVWFGGEK